MAAKVSPRHTHSMVRRHVLPGRLNSHAAQSSSVTMALGCSLYKNPVGNQFAGCCPCVVWPKIMWRQEPCNISTCISESQMRESCEGDVCSVQHGADLLVRMMLGYMAATSRW